MPSLRSEVQLTYILITTVFLRIFRAIDIGLHFRDFHTAQSAHSAGVQKVWPIIDNQPDEAYSEEALMKAYK